MSSELTGGDDQQKNVQGADDLQEAAKKAAELEEKLNKAISERDSWKQKHRDAESAAAAAKQLQDDLDAERATRSKLEDAFNSYRDSVKQRDLSSHLTTALEAAGAKSITTVLKLLDTSKIEFDEEGNIKQETVSAVIADLRNSDPVLFVDEQSDPNKKAPSGGTTLQPPDVKVAAGGINTQSAYDTEMKSAKTQADVERIARKYKLK